MIPEEETLLSVVCLAPAPPIALVLLQEYVQEAKQPGNPSPPIQGSEPMTWKKNCKEKRKGPGDFTWKQIILVTLFLWNLPLPESSLASVGHAGLTGPPVSFLSLRFEAKASRLGPLLWVLSWLWAH